MTTKLIFETLYEEICADYRRELEIWVNAAGKMIAGLCSSPSKSHWLEGPKELKILVHKIAGSSGSFDLPNVSKKAEVLEDFCFSLIKQKQPATSKNILDLRLEFLAMAVVIDKQL